MSLTDEERKILVDLEYEKAKLLVEQAERIMELGYWDMMANLCIIPFFMQYPHCLLKMGIK